MISISQGCQEVRFITMYSRHFAVTSAHPTHTEGNRNIPTEFSELQGLDIQSRDSLLPYGIAWILLRTWAPSAFQMKMMITGDISTFINSTFNGSTWSKEPWKISSRRENHITEFGCSSPHSQKTARLKITKVCLKQMLMMGKVDCWLPA